MGGWRIAPHEMHRFNVKAAQELADVIATGRTDVGITPLAEATAKIASVKVTIDDKILAQQAAVNTHAMDQSVHPDKQEKRRTVLVIVPDNLHAYRSTDVAETIHKLSGLANEGDDIITAAIGDALSGVRAGLILATDMMLGWLNRGHEDTQWWRGTLLSHKAIGAPIHFVSMADVFNAVRPMNVPHACSSVSTPSSENPSAQ
jgi:hypothetical protein